MVVTDFRTGSIKEEPIAVSATLDEITADMRSLGYLTESQTLTLGEIDLGLEDDGEDEDDYEDEAGLFPACQVSYDFIFNV